MSAQDKKVPSEDYSIPDAPAFSVMNSTPSTILRPSTGRELAVAIGNQFFSKQNSSIAVEYAPIPKLSFSVGLQNGEKGELALGSRWNIIDKIEASDDLEVAKLRKLLNPLNARASKASSITLDSIMRVNNCDVNIVIIKYNSEYNLLQNKILQQMDNDPNYDHSLEDNFKKALEEMNWNKSILTIAVAYRNNYSALNFDEEGFGHDNKFQFWGTYSHGLGKIFKLDIGTTGGIENIADTTQNQFGIGLKGTYSIIPNSFRIEVGGEFKYNDKKLKGNRVSIDRPLSLCLGIEWRAFDNNWVVFQLAKDGNSSKYVPKIEYKTAM